MEKKLTVGVTEQGDPALNFSWLDHLDVVDFAIVQSKGADQKFEDALLENKNKIIYHATCTGLGGTIFEPNVPTVKEKFEHLSRLINFGFSPAQIVVRIDPLMPFRWVENINKVVGIDYLAKLLNILIMTENLGIKRVRYSYLNLYDFVIDKFKRVSPEFKMYPNILEPDYRTEIQLDKMNPRLEYEACNEFYVPNHHQIPCLSNKDLKIMDFFITKDLDEKLQNDPGKPYCKCPNNKLELLHFNKFECKFNCMYCYWNKK